MNKTQKIRHICLSQLRNKTMKKLFNINLIILSSVVLGGCASNYPCGEPSSGKCMSVTQNYERSYTNYVNPDDLPAQNGGTSRVTDNDSNNPIKLKFTNYAQTPADGAPLLTMPKMLRVWLTPYTDSDNIYHDQSYEYIIVDRGRWNYNNNKLLMNDSSNLQNVTPAQVTDEKGGGYGGYGMADQPPKSTNPTPTMPPLTGFPAINQLQNGQNPQVMTTTIGGGIDRTTEIIP